MQYTKSFQDVIDRNALSEIPLQDLSEWSGHVNWNTQYNVLKDSATTPVILVSNSSIQNGSTILNELLTKSPTHLTDILAIYLG